MFDRGQQGGARDAQAGELGGAEVADDGRVGEQEEGLGDEGEEGRDGQPQDVAPLAGRWRTAAVAPLRRGGQSLDRVSSRASA